jgi:hypothetical protein
VQLVKREKGVVMCFAAGDELGASQLHHPFCSRSEQRQWGEQNGLWSATCKEGKRCREVLCGG